MSEELNDLLDEVATPTAAPQLSTTAQEQDQFDPYGYAKDCAWVWSRLGQRPTLKEAVTGGRFELWKYANKNKKEFTTQTMKVVAPILDRILAKTPTDDAMKDKERKSVRELQVFFRGVVKQATNGV